MIRLNRQKVAGLAAFLGGGLQAALLFFQMSQLSGILERRFHTSWNWNIPREYRWIAVSPWFFFLIALLAFYWYIAQQLRWPVWRGAIAISLPIMAIIIPEIAQTFVFNPNCMPNLPCNPGNTTLPIILSGISITGGVFLGCYLLFLGAVLIHAPISKIWVYAFSLLGVLTFYPCLVAAELSEWIPGYFKIDIIAIVSGLIWATTWVFIGCLLCLNAFLPQGGVRLEDYKPSFE